MLLRWGEVAKAAYEEYAKHAGEADAWDELESTERLAWIKAVQCACDLYAQAI